MEVICQLLQRQGLVEAFFSSNNLGYLERNEYQMFWRHFFLGGFNWEDEILCGFMGFYPPSLSGSFFSFYRVLLEGVGFLLILLLLVFHSFWIGLSLLFFIFFSLVAVLLYIDRYISLVLNFLASMLVTFQEKEGDAFKCESIMSP